MKKKLVSLLLAGIMLFGTCTSVYAASLVSSGLDSIFAASSEVCYTKSTTSTWYAHVHEYTVNIRAYSSVNSAYKNVTATRVYDSWGDVVETTVEPTIYSVGYYVGKSFLGTQKCEVSIPETGESETCSEIVY